MPRENRLSRIRNVLPVEWEAWKSDNLYISIENTVTKRGYFICASALLTESGALLKSEPDIFNAIKEVW